MDVETADIPSDNESDDGLCDSDDENENVDLIGEDLGIDDDDDDSDTDDDLHDTLNVNGEIWNKTEKLRDDVPFIKNFGPNIPDTVKSPLDVFFCLFPPDFIDYIVEQTNLYRIQRGSSQKDVTRKEILIFLGMNIMMGIKKPSSYRDCWSMNSQLRDSFISNLMTVNRFGFLLSHLHLNDTTKEPKRGASGYDKLYKIRPMLDKLNETFKSCWKPNKYQAVDESMIKFKGRSSIKQYMPAKPVKRGYKCWVRADESGFVCEFQVYTGKTESRENMLGARVVKDLTRDLVGGNHHVYFDNFFTSVDLTISLKKEKIFACGTVRKNRARLPKSQIPDKKLKKGDSEFQTSNTGVRWIKWMDNRVVYFLSNYHNPCEETVATRRNKDGSLNTIPSPVMASDYNKHMGYVDYADRLVSTYKIDRKSKRWWLRLFWHFLDVTVVNAFILYKEKNLLPSLTLKKFRLDLVDKLVGNQIATPKGRKPRTQIVGPHKPQVSVEKRRSESSHMPVYNPEGKRRRCASCSTKTSEKRSAWSCTTCDVSLCLTSTVNCFSNYHR